MWWINWSRRICSDWIGIPFDRFFCGFSISSAVFVFRQSLDLSRIDRIIRCSIRSQGDASVFLTLSSVSVSSCACAPIQAPLTGCCAFVSAAGGSDRAGTWKWCVDGGRQNHGTKREMVENGLKSYLRWKIGCLASLRRSGIRAFSLALLPKALSSLPRVWGHQATSFCIQGKSSIMLLLPFDCFHCIECLLHSICIAWALQKNDFVELNTVAQIAPGTYSTLFCLNNKVALFEHVNVPFGITFYLLN